MQHTISSSTQTEARISVDRKTQVKENEFEVKANVESSEYLKNKFESYPCFYCVSSIASKKHIVECHRLYQPVFLQVSRSPTRNKIKTKYEEQPKLKPMHQSSQLMSFPVGFPPPSMSPFSALSSLLKCEHCDRFAISGTNMMKHKKAVHNYDEIPLKLYFYIYYTYIFT